MTAIEFLQYISDDSCKNRTSLQYVLSNIPAGGPLLRKQAAKIVHVYMKEILGIPDETNTEKIQYALKLKDIYDCRTCVEDIIQVYSRGIMEAFYDIPEMGMKAFGGNEEMDYTETEQIKCKIKALF